MSRQDVVLWPQRAGMEVYVSTSPAAVWPYEKPVDKPLSLYLKDKQPQPRHGLLKCDLT